jgi:hypothetical protein
VTDNLPTITILGDNPTTIFVGDTYTDAGATATDVQDADTTLTVTITNNLDTATEGSYTFDYSVTDSDGNVTMESRDVNVVMSDSKLTKMGLIADSLIDLKDTTDNKTDKKINKVIQKIDKAMDSKYWDEFGNELTSDKGKKVFDENQKAVKDLLKISKKSNFIYPEITSAVDMLVGLSEQLATDAFNDAQSFAGDKKIDKQIRESNKNLNKAQEKLDDGKPKEAIDRYEKAWKHAQKAMELKIKDEDNGRDRDDDDELEVKIKIEDGEAEVKVEFYEDEYEFELDTSNVDEILEITSLRTGISVELLEEAMELKVKDDDDRDD